MFYQVIKKFVDCVYISAFALILDIVTMFTIIAGVIRHW